MAAGRRRARAQRPRRLRGIARGRDHRSRGGVALTATRVAAPFRGLAPFGESELDGLLFFGRERETEIVTANLIASRLTVLYGPSGVGKSSLLRAGVARRIRQLGARHAVARGPDLACVVFSSWADDPCTGLTAAIGAAVRPLVTPTAPEPPVGTDLAGVAEHWSSLLEGDLCLVLDQFEELFVYHPDASAFLAELARLVTENGLRVNVLVAIRDDELARLGALKALLPSVFANSRRLDRLDRDAARAAILGPLQRWNEQAAEAAVEIEPELVDAVVDETAVDAVHVEAPYLQLVMERVWDQESRAGSRTLRRATLDELGGARVVVREHLGRALSALDPDEQAAAAQMFAHLVTPSGSKIAHRESDLAKFAHVGTDESRSLLETLGRERIVRPLDDHGDDRRYEIFHDVLAEAIVEWGAGRELVQARQRQRRLLVGLLGATGVALITIAIAIFALTQRSEARKGSRHARAGAFAAASFAASPTDPETALRLARAAAAYDHSPEIESVLRNALDRSRERAALRGGRQRVLGAAVTAAGAATLDTRGTLRWFGAKTGPPWRTQHVLPKARAAAFAAGGSAAAVAGRRLVVVRALTGGRSFALRVRSPVRTLAIAGNGDRVAVSTLDGHIVVRGADGRTRVIATGPTQTCIALDETGRTVAAGNGHVVTVWREGKRVARIVAKFTTIAVALSPDGKLVATGGADGGTRLWRVPHGAYAGIGLALTPVTSVAFASDGKAYASGARDGLVRVFDTDTGRLVTTLAGLGDSVATIAFSPSTRELVAGADDGDARIWESGLTPELSLVDSPPGCCQAVAARGDVALVAAGSRVVEYLARKRVATITQPARITSLAAAQDFVATGGKDGRVRVFGANGRGFGVGSPVVGVAAAGRVVVAATAAGRVEARTIDGHVLASFREKVPVGAVAISPDGRTLATGGADGTTRLREIRGGRLVGTLDGDTKPLLAVAFSSDGASVAAAGDERDIRIWDVASRHEVFHIPAAHSAAVLGLAFSPDGRWLVTAGPSKAGLWDLQTGARLDYLRGHDGPLVGVAYAGGDIVTAGTDGTVRAYRCLVCGGFDDLVALADRRIAATGGGLTPEQKRLYLVP